MAPSLAAEVSVRAHVPTDPSLGAGRMEHQVGSSSCGIHNVRALAALEICCGHMVFPTGSRNRPLVSVEFL
jgi:hypothetical protein